MLSVNNYNIYKKKNHCLTFLPNLYMHINAPRDLNTYFSYTYMNKTLKSDETTIKYNHNYLINYYNFRVETYIIYKYC